MQEYKEKEKRDRKAEWFKIIHYLTRELPGANFFVFVDLLSPWGFSLTQKPKEYYKHDA